MFFTCTQSIVTSGSGRGDIVLKFLSSNLSNEDKLWVATGSFTDTI